MRLETVREALNRQVRSKETTHHFQAARERHPALQPFGDAEAAIAFLNDNDPARRPDRSAVTRSMVEEVQARGPTCWSAILMVAYFPGLLRIRGALQRKGGLSREDLDWLVIESFIEVAGRMPLETQGRLAVVNLVLGTRKAVFEQLRREWRRREVDRPFEGPIDELLTSTAPSPEKVLLRRDIDRHLSPDRIRAWVRYACKDEPEDDLLLVLGTYASGTPLITFVRERWADADSGELLRHYERCRRRRSRLLDRLRKRIRNGAVSHPAINPALLQQEAWR